VCSTGSIKSVANAPELHLDELTERMFSKVGQFSPTQDG
jgi:hypothetical protein